MSQSLNRYSYVLNNPLSMIDPSGFNWLSSAWHSIKHFFSKYWRVIAAIVVSVVTFGTLAPLASAWLATACLLEGTITVGGAIVAGAISGALAGGIVGGWKGALAGAVTGAILGGAGAYYGNTWNAGRVAVEGTAGGIGSEIQGGSFIDGFKMAAGFAMLEWGAYKMRASMVAQSCTPEGNINCQGSSAGTRFDGDTPRKLAGGRFADWLKEEFGWGQRGSDPSFFGGYQGGPGYLGFDKLGYAYESGSFTDHLLESYAGPHDWLSSFRYASNGNLIQYSSWAARAAFGVYSAIAILPATPFAFATAVPSNAFVPAMRTDD